jgi:hypothetical protein
MGKKFDKIFETVIQRGEAGGFLPGDCVKFRTGYKNTETYKHMPSTLQKEVDELDKCGLNIKVVQVGDKQSGFSTGNQFKPAGCVVLTIAADHGGGRTYGRVTVTTDMVDISDGVLVPDKFKKKDVVIIKPKKLEVDPNLITNVTDKGNGKNTPTDLKLAGESKSWDFTKELGNIYDEILQEKFDFKKADRNKNGKLEDWEENIGKKVFGDDEDEDDSEDNDEDNEDCGEQDEQDACYKKVKSRYDVFPSAYASGALVKCRKVGAKNWGNSKK